MIFSQKEIQRHQWILNNVRIDSPPPPYFIENKITNDSTIIYVFQYDYHHTPLVGMILMQLKCNLTKITIQKHGFLTMYEVVSGYGAWSRNWFYLDGEKLSFWKYHEQEMTQVGKLEKNYRKFLRKVRQIFEMNLIFRTLLGPSI